jgi:hypothetical protein
MFHFYFLLQANDRADQITRPYLLRPRFLPVDAADIKIF